MELREFGPDDADDIATYVAMAQAVLAVDAPWRHGPTPYRHEMEMRHGWDGEPSRFFLAEVDAEPVGMLEVATSDYDNLDLAWLGIDVHPDHRRRGHGRALVDLARDLCLSIGRPLVGTDGWEDPGVDAFAATTGFERKSQAINRRQFLAELPEGRVQQVYDEAAAASGDYELVMFEGRSPDELIEQVAQMTAAINDAPLDDLELEDEAFPPERIREYERHQAESGWRLYRLVARHRATGELAGHTVVAVDSERPQLGEQHDTSVVGTHRGHRLGALLKSGMLLHLRDLEPQLAEIDTWNAESNDHMIGVNELLGYRIMGREVQYQRRF